MIEIDMKKIALAFDLTVISLLFGSSFSAKDISRFNHWTEFGAQLLITAAVILLLTGIVKRIRN